MFERKDIKTRSLSSGDELSIPVFFFKGTDKDAPSVYIQSSIHGAELQGYLVALLLIEYFAQRPPKGDVTIVPLANPYGMNNKLGEHTLGRFDPSTGENWNRFYENVCCLKECDKQYINQIVIEQFIDRYPDMSFSQLAEILKGEIKNYLLNKLNIPQPYSKKLNLQLQLLASQADIVLDLHCDTLSKPHVYTPAYALDSAVKLNFPFIIEIPEHFNGALDEATFSPWLLLLQAYNAKNNEKMSRPPFESFTIELGDQEQINQEDGKKQVEGILFYLSHKGVCDFNNIKRVPIVTAKLCDFITLYSPSGGIIIDSAPLGIAIEAQAPLMIISNLAKMGKDIVSSDVIKISSHSICCPQSCTPITRIDSANVHEGMPVMKILVKTQKIV